MERLRSSRTPPALGTSALPLLSHISWPQHKLPPLTARCLWVLRVSRQVLHLHPPDGAVACADAPRSTAGHCHSSFKLGAIVHGPLGARLAPRPCGNAQRCIAQLLGLRWVNRLVVDACAPVCVIHPLCGRGTMQAVGFADAGVTIHDTNRNRAPVRRREQLMFLVACPEAT